MAFHSFQFFILPKNVSDYIRNFCKQQYGLHFRKFVLTNLRWPGLELGSVQLQAGVLPI